MPRLKVLNLRSPSLRYRSKPSHKQPTWQKRPHLKQWRDQHLSKLNLSPSLLPKSLSLFLKNLNWVNNKLKSMRDMIVMNIRWFNRSSRKPSLKKSSSNFNLMTHNLNLKLKITTWLKLHYKRIQVLRVRSNKLLKLILMLWHTLSLKMVKNQMLRRQKRYQSQRLFQKRRFLQSSQRLSQRKQNLLWFKRKQQILIKTSLWEISLLKQSKIISNHLKIMILRL
jgi:hypothetical protein